MFALTVHSLQLNVWIGMSVWTTLQNPGKGLCVYLYVCWLCLNSSGTLSTSIKAIPVCCAWDKQHESCQTLPWNKLYLWGKFPISPGGFSFLKKPFQVITRRGNAHPHPSFRTGGIVSSSESFQGTGRFPCHAPKASFVGNVHSPPYARRSHGITQFTHQVWGHDDLFAWGTMPAKICGSLIMFNHHWWILLV